MQGAPGSEREGIEFASTGRTMWRWRRYLEVDGDGMDGGICG
jgi:hypothetical protein